jgi:deoxycytidylate deaminase
MSKMTEEEIIDKTAIAVSAADDFTGNDDEVDVDDDDEVDVDVDVDVDNDTKDTNTTNAAAVSIQQYPTLNSTSSSSPVSSASAFQRLQDRFELYGWTPNPKTLTYDELYMDIVFLITRSVNADGQQGHMGALIVRPPSNSSDTNTNDIFNKDKNDSNSNNDENDNTETELVAATSSSLKIVEQEQEQDDDNNNDEDEDNAIITNFDERQFYENIVGIGTNTSLFNNNECTSDIHAEINALGEVCRRQNQSTSENCTAYITIPPCKRCFAALVTFGIKRIVTRQQSSKLIQDTAVKYGIECKHFNQTEKRNQMIRINKLVNPNQTDEELMKITEQMQFKRKVRKAERQLSSSKRREHQQQQQQQHHPPPRQ